MLMWIDEEYNRIKPKTKSNAIGIEIDGQEYLPGNDGALCVYRKALKGFLANELPPNLILVPVIEANEEFINQGSFQGDIVYDGNMMVCISEFVIYADRYTGEFQKEDLNEFNEVYKKIINLKLVIEEFIDECKYKAIRFYFNVMANMDIACVLDIMEDTIDNIFGSPKAHYNFENMSEEVFTMYYVIPALEKNGMKNVYYTHGIEEYGRDVVYQFYDNFGQLRYGSAQVKKGNISGNANGKLKEVLEQIDDSFAMPYKDLLKKQEVNIEQVVIICSGKYTNNAKEKIMNKVIEGRNVIFLDGQNIGDML